jgi:hypothetical protein
MAKTPRLLKADQARPEKQELSIEEELEALKKRLNTE